MVVPFSDTRLSINDDSEDYGRLFMVSIGERYGRLTILSVGETKEGRPACLCLCDCGGEFVVRNSYLLSGRVKRCNLHQDRHGDTGTKLYKCWESLKYRARSEHLSSYVHVDMSASWDRYSVFASWAKENGWEEGLTIDRKDNERGYYPDNCRFVSRKEQNRNRRCNKINLELATEIRSLPKATPRKHIMDKYNLSRSGVWRILTNRAWVV